MNTNISFENAKLLKEKGFDNESVHYYNEKGEMLFDTYFPSLQPTKPDIYYDNPTIADVCMWLYEKHNLFVTTYWFTMGANEYAFKIVNVYEEEQIKDSFFGAGASYTGGWHTPTEAYESAIEYTLKELL